MALNKCQRKLFFAKWLIERIGLKDSISAVKLDGRSENKVLDIQDHTQAAKALLDDLILSNPTMRLQVWATVTPWRILHDSAFGR